jgi:subtilase family serine protease
MRSQRWLFALLAAAVIASAFAGASAAKDKVKAKDVCTLGAEDEAACHAKVVTDDAGTPLATTSPTGLTPQDFWSAYNLPYSTGGAGQTIAIVDAFDYPTAENDLNVFSAQFGLPACTTANGCFRKVNQDGGSNVKKYRTNSGWALEAALDLETAHAVCPSCKILFVETQTNSFANLSTGVNTAAALGANAISNSYGGAEFSLETSTTYGGAYNHPGVAITVSSGDSGFGVQFPAASPYVTAVGGTTLTRSGTPRGWTETAWDGAGSGCSTYVAKPSWQTSVTACPRRAVADVSADADPASGTSVYDTTPYQGQAGWFQVGGTSLAAPLIAGVYGLAGDAAGTSYPVSLAWTNHGSFNDVTSGSNGTCGAPLCTAGSGWDGPTGWGTPWGTAGF